MTTLNHPEITAMQSIVDAFAGLTKPQREAVARKILLVSDAEITALTKALDALKVVQGVEARTRVIRWAMDAYKAPKTARAKKPKEKEPATKPSPVSPVREAWAG